MSHFAQQYNQYLATLGTSAEAQNQIVNQILPQAELQAEVEKTLNTSQTITVPTLQDSQIKISNSVGKAAMQKYLSDSGSLFDNLKTITDSGLNDIYNSAGDQNKVNSLIADVALADSQYQKIPVPKEAADFHLNWITTNNIDIREDYVKVQLSELINKVITERQYAQK